MLDTGRHALGTVLREPPVSQSSPQTASLARGPVAPQAEAPAPTPAEHPGRGRTIVRWLGVVAMLYLLVCAIGVIGDGFNGLGEQTAHTTYRLQDASE